MNEHILLTFGFDGNGGGARLSTEDISNRLKDDRLVWTHLDANHPDTRDWLNKELAYLDPFIIEALLVEETRPRMTKINQGLLLILRGMNFNENTMPEDMVSIRLWVDDHRIISLRRRTLKAVRDIEERIIDGRGPKDSGDFICMLSALLIARMEPVLSDLAEKMDYIEEQVLEDASAELREAIVTIRKQALVFKRYIVPQRDAMRDIRMTDIKWLDERHGRYLHELHNQVTRYVEDLDAVRERAQIVKDELANIMADRLNRNMYVLSVIAAIFLPLGFLTGLLGINVGGIPGTESGNAFWIFSALLIGVVVVQVIIFRRLKWF